MNSTEMTVKLFLCTAGAVLVAIITGHWMIALGIAAGIALAFGVVTKIFRATERGDFLGFIEDAFPEETKEIKQQRRKRNEVRNDRNRK